MIHTRMGSVLLLQEQYLKNTLKIQISKGRKLEIVRYNQGWKSPVWVPPFSSLTILHTPLISEQETMDNTCWLTRTPVPWPMTTINPVSIMLFNEFKPSSHIFYFDLVAHLYLHVYVIGNHVYWDRLPTSQRQLFKKERKKRSSCLATLILRITFY